MGSSLGVYVSTIAVRPDRRRAGYARRLYEALFSLTGDPAEWVVVRTWSTNDAHVPLLRQLGFRFLLTEEDHRGVGVHTFYFGRPWGGPVDEAATDPASR
jgi:ribosomal protein S18 acetylase RimI-like enzyme